MNLKFIFGSVQVLILIFIVSVGADDVLDYCDIGNCSQVANASSIISSNDPNIVVWKLSNDSDSSVNAGDNFTFWIWVYNFGKGNATIDIRDYLDECFIFLNQTMVFYNGTSDNQFITYSFSTSNGNLTWSNIFVPGNGSASYIYFKIFLNVSTGNCHGNFTNFVKVNGTNSNNQPLGYLCELCRGNYTQKCTNICNNNNCIDNLGDICNNDGYSDTSDCISSCESAINKSNFINSGMVANKTVEIISSELIDLNLLKSAPLNTTYGEVIQFNISWSVVHPSGNVTNITITDYLPSQVSFVNCSNSCVYSNGNVLWNFMDVVNGSSGVVYLNVSVISLIGNILNNITVKGKSGDIIGNKVANSNTEILSGHISGKIFNDTNSNGTCESIEGGLITNLSIVGITEFNVSYSILINSLANGTFDIIVPWGTYNITAALVTNMINTTSLIIYDVFVNSTVGSTGNDFGFWMPTTILCPEEVNVSCYQNANITVLINGIETYTFDQSGKPYNVTVIAKDEFGSPLSNLTIQMVEKNGNNPFALSQVNISNVTNYLKGETRTNSEGKVSFTLVPTGGIWGIENNIGRYWIKIYSIANCGLINIKEYNVFNRTLPAPNETLGSIPNRNNTIAAKEYVYHTYDKIKRWLSLGGGENHDVTVYANGTVIGMPINVVSGKPIGLHMSVMYPNGTPVKNAKIVVTEMNGHNPFALTQVSESNITNYMTAETYTGGNGKVNFTIVPTGGIWGVENNIGNYDINLWVYMNDTPPCNYYHNIYAGHINVTNRTLPSPSGYAEAIPNIDNLIAAKEYIYHTYDKIKRWLT